MLKDKGPEETKRNFRRFCQQLIDRVYDLCDGFYMITPLKRSILQRRSSNTLEEGILITIGEKLNSSIPKTLEAVKERDEAYLISLIRDQFECGADYLDINTAVAGQETENMVWLIQLVTAHSDCGIMIDSQNPETIQASLPLCTGRQVIVNSVTPSAAFEPLFPVLAEYGAGVVCMPAGSVGLSQTPVQRAENAMQLCRKLTGAGIREENLYVDVMAEALATADQAGVAVLEMLHEIRRRMPFYIRYAAFPIFRSAFPSARNPKPVFSCNCNGERGWTARSWMLPLPRSGETLAACTALLGQDEFCMEYIRFIRASEK